MTIQKKTALIFTGITAAILLLTSCVAYVFMNVFAFKDFYKRLEIRGIITAKARLAQRHVEVGKVYSDIRAQHLEPLAGEKEFFFPKDSLAGFRSSKEAEALPDAFYQQLLAGRPANAKKGNYFYTGLKYDDGQEAYIVIVGAQNQDSVRYARKLKWILIACCLCGTIVAYTSGIFFSRHAFKPVRDIIDKAKTIEAENLHLRIEDRKGEDELSELTATFNDMLSRLETAFETQNNFVSNASHEFRTPLTTIYGEADVALSKVRTNEEYVTALQTILNQTERLQQLTDSLLNLAQTGFDGKRQNPKTILIVDLLHEVKNTISKIVPLNNVQIRLGNIHDGGKNPAVTGTYNLLKLGLSNVIENACKYSGNGPVTVTLNITGERLQITVADRGIGIPQQELKYIYDPFFRASNTDKYEGYGIGLPLTRNIFRLHKGSINVTSAANAGTTVTMTLPLA